MSLHTKDRLAKALFEAGLPTLATAAANGEFDDFLSASPHPQADLIDKLRLFPTPEAKKIMNDLYEGIYDSTKEESDEWAASPAGQEVFRRLVNNE